MILTGIHFNYYQVCKRKLWLFANGINMEHTSDLVYDGKLIHETAYPQRPERYEELEMGRIKIDYYDAKNRVIHEIKRSDKIENAHEWQVKYYIYVLEKTGIDGVVGILEYPALRHTAQVTLSDVDREKIQEMEKEIVRIVLSEACPSVINARICKKCSYYEFCYVNEEK
ncbi:CRISPR-associated protein Cas4 [Bacteroides pyogenes]|uniref:CRISPR-associated exonuclease Cas4 n=1 Tax=Bacteroides pyogenes TaxID=310300 RepID=A0A5D3EFP2_9BACE|nr:CRISPR-associated protein Cas4 [Bacteroides pyogenes]MDY4250123.1 CRISPR-associated protein Cas4 [Bacteroides pyogenes]TYK34280.1 CRISPR-associated protein Cas4 [Bacteroides pyogenes]TYK37291.1 CRISPR-associated protein Cas4 [Bacteroides pyogenes]TYK50267.1 CRISPR-associated protein Cas4 [Bacteroides pyogenes]